MARKAAGKRVDMLSARFVETVKKPGLHGDGRNLYLKVDERGNKSWILRWEVEDVGGELDDKKSRKRGKVAKMGLGSLGAVSLAQARDLAEKNGKLIKDGTDPRQARDAKKAAAAVAEAKTISFDDACDAYIKAKRSEWKNDKHSKQWKATLQTYASPHFGALPVDAIDVGLVMRALQPIWVSKPETSHRVRGRIEAVLDWARAFGYRDEKTLNPARWKGHLDKLLAKRDKKREAKHHAALPFDEMPDFMRKLRERDGVAALALQFCILTATRTSETLNATYSEIDLENRTWTIKAERMKGGLLHRVPLSDDAVAIIEDMRSVKRSDYIFPGAKRGKPLSNMSMLLTLRRMGRGDLTAHGFRSSFKTWSSERGNFKRELAEKALAHLVGDETERAYDRGDLFEKRRRLMNAWAGFCSTRGTAKATDNVVGLMSQP